MNMCFEQKGAITTLSGKSLKLVEQFTYLGYISSTENVNIYLVKAQNAINRLMIGKSNLSNKIKQDFFHVVAFSILLYGFTIYTLKKCITRKLDRKYPIMLNMADLQKLIYISSVQIQDAT